MRKLICLLIALLMTVTMLASCGGDKNDGTDTSGAASTNAVTVAATEKQEKPEKPAATEEPQTPNREWTNNY